MTALHHFYVQIYLAKWLKYVLHYPSSVLSLSFPHFNVHFAINLLFKYGIFKACKFFGHVQYILHKFLMTPIIGTLLLFYV